jgi:hypothetical protein
MSVGSPGGHQGALAGEKPASANVGRGEVPLGDRMRLFQDPPRYRGWATLLAVTLTRVLLGFLGDASGHGRTLRVRLLGFSSAELRESYWVEPR